MIRAFTSEWVKLARRGQLLGSWGTMAGFAILLSALLLSNASDLSEAEWLAMQAEAAQNGNQGAPVIPLFLLEASDGLVFSFQATGQLLGIIALVIAAANVATEYTSGSLKVLLIRQPIRPMLFGGKLAALASFVAAGIALTAVASVLMTVAIAAARGMDTSEWWTADGILGVLKAYANVTLAALGWTVLGMALAVLFRSGFPAIGVGIAYPLVVEGLIGLVLPDVAKWMPGSVLGRLAEGSTSQAFAAQAAVGYGEAALLGALYTAVFAAVAFVVVTRRDVST